MITESQIYWITRLDGLKECLTILCVLMAIAGTIGLVVSLISYVVNKVNDDKLVSMSKKCILVSVLVVSLAIILGLVHVLTPTTKEMCAIKVIPIIVNNENIQELPNKAVELANEWMEELKPKKEN